MNEQINLGDYLSPPLVVALREIGAFATDQGMPAYIVGGAVREILLRDTHYDIDLMVEGDATVLAKELFRRWSTVFPGVNTPRKPLCFSRYRTAKLQFDAPGFLGQSELDFASARRETYVISGEAPEVAPSDLRSDLARRDFSVNAMAVAISPSNFGEFVDPHHGRRDLEARLLRVLHKKSFVDDPVRLMRGVRFELRFGFSFEEQTERLFNEAVRGEFLKRVPQPRRFDEFRKAVEDRAAEAVLERLLRLGILEQIFESIPVERLALAVSRFRRGEGALAEMVLCLLPGAQGDALRSGIKNLGASGPRLEAIVQRAEDIQRAEEGR